MKDIVLYKSTYNKLYEFCFVATFCIQCTDIKFASIKVGELVMLAYLIFHVGKLDKFVASLLLFFVLFLVNSFINTALSDLYPPAGVNDLLKKPYFISIARFLEYISCLGFVTYCHNSLRQLTNQGISLSKIISKILTVNAILIAVFIAEYVLLLTGLLAVNESMFYYDSSVRLKGFYVEGGPLGLCIAFLACVCYTLDFSPYKYIKIGVMVLAVLLAQSKAGILCLGAFFLVVAYRKVHLPRFFLPVVLTAVGGLAALMVAVVAQGYIRAFQRIPLMISEHSTDTNFVMGRVSGLFIVPSIIAQNIFWGIGAGNYPLVRNNPAYRSFFPEVELWDASGLGGLVDLLMEGGLILLVLFFYIIWRMYTGIKSEYRFTFYLLICFMLPFLMGVQLHFFYPWLAIAILLFVRRSNRISVT